MRRSWLLAGLGLAALAVVVWYAGPLLIIGGASPLASPKARALVVAGLGALYGLQQLWMERQGRRNNARVVAALEPAPAPAPASAAGMSRESDRLREQFTSALAQLRRARLGAARGRGSWSFGRSYLYQLPWYMIIGSPGAGKTTALLNSGLRFPLADQLGRGPVGGVGGTRNCDWWFTDEAVLIDTAGRYTTQDSDPAADRAAWRAFLDLLRRSRPRRPLNGVLVAVAVDELLGFTSSQRADHARLLRGRLDELQSTLRVRLPVYVLLTKCDLLPGFVDWFGALDRAQREDVLGVTFPLRAAHTGSAVNEFAAAFDALVNGLADTLVGRLEAERDGQRRARIFLLPRQLRALGEPLESLLRAAFAPQRATGVNAEVLLRGVYLTSGTQAGTPIDRILSAFGRELGVSRQILPANSSSGRSFFLSRALTDVVFAEADLSGQTPLRQRRRQRVLAGCIVALQAGALILACGWLAGYWRTRSEMVRFAEEVTRLSALADAVSGGAEADPRAMLPALDGLGALARGPPAAQDRPSLLDIGRGSRRKIAAAARQAYENFLRGPFQARIAASIDATLRTGADMNVQYEALKAYAMLRDPPHFDATGFKIFVLSYWDSALPTPLSAGERRALGEHLDALLEAGAVGSGITVEPALIDSVRNRLALQSSAQRLAMRLNSLFNLQPLPDFTVTVIPGAAGLFVGAGKSAAPAVPGFYTLDAYSGFVLPRAPDVAAQLRSEALWVLNGAPPAVTAAQPAAADLAAAGIAEFESSYRAAYAQTWARFVDELHLSPASADKDAVRQASALAEPDGPLAQLLEAIAGQTPARLANGTAGPIEPADPLAERFATLARFVAPDERGVAPLAGAQRSFRELQAARARGAGADEILGRLIGQAQSDPEPVRSMLVQLAMPEGGSTPGSAVSGSAWSRQIAARLGPSCVRLVAGQFPFDRRAARDAPLDEFSRVFAPNGAFDEVAKQMLRTHPRPAAASEARDDERFRSAARIRDVLFAHGAHQPAVELTFRPVDMDPSIDRFELDADGQSVYYAHGPVMSTVIKWPGTQGHARVKLTPASGGGTAEYDGPWALFRLMDHAAIQEQGSAAHFLVVFEMEGRRASFDVESSSGGNPFRLRELENFDCPTSVR